MLQFHPCGGFAEEGIEIQLTNGGGADKVMTAVLTDQADIGLAGPEACIYVYNQGKEDYPRVFAQLTKRDGSFLVGRTNESFEWADLRGKTIIGGRQGGMPQMVLEYILHQNGIEMGTDADVITNLDLSATASAFAAGPGDYTTEFEPGASTLELAGQGHVVASLGVDSGYVPYTVYMTTSSLIEKKPELIQGFTNAIYKGLSWCQTHTSAEIAEVIHPQFSETDLTTLTTIIERYRSQDTWIDHPLMKESSLDLIQDILQHAGTLEERISYENAVVTTFAQNAAIQ